MTKNIESVKNSIFQKEYINENIHHYDALGNTSHTHNYQRAVECKAQPIIYLWHYYLMSKPAFKSKHYYKFGRCYQAKAKKEISEVKKKRKLFLLAEEWLTNWEREVPQKKIVTC